MRRTFFLLTIFMLAACSNGGQKPEEVDPTIFPSLIGGTVADPKEWKNSVFITSGSSGCSATLVGERALLTAAHCVRNGAKASFSVGPNRYTATCVHHPEYARNATADWAACLVDKVVDGGPFENMNVDSQLIKIAEYVTLTGYGCQKWGGPIDGKYRIGESPVTNLPSGTNYDIVTRGKAALCSGDSGGPAFKRWADGRRVLISVNSRSNTTTTSYIPSVAQPTAQKFFKEWATAKAVLICGIHPNAKNCRDQVLPPANEFTVDAKVATATVKLKATFEGLLDELKAELETVFKSHE